MPPTRIVHRFLPRLLAGSCLLALGPAVPESHAVCGLRECPREGGALLPARRTLSVSAGLRQTQFEIGGVRGNFSQIAPRLELSPPGHARWRLGIVAPLVTLRLPEGRRTGAGNPLLFAQFRALKRGPHALELGAQAEIPWGDADAGLASDHTELLPYARYRRATGALLLDVTAGYRLALGAGPGGGNAALPSAPAWPVAPSAPVALHRGHLHAVAPDFVDPHEERELLARLGVRATPGSIPLDPAVHLEAVHVIAGESLGEDLLNSGVSVAIPLPGRVGLDAAFSVPLTTARRFEWSGDLALTLR